MLAKDFIYEKLDALARAFPHIAIKYKYNHLAETHIVELSPVEYYYGDTTLDEAWLNIVKEFLVKFPSEDISFISSDSILKIEKPEFSFNTHERLNLHIAYPQELLSEFYKALADKIDWHNIAIPHIVVFESHQDIRFVDSISSLAYTHGPTMNLNILSNAGLLRTEAITVNFPDKLLVSAGENSFAMAA
jgi:hypothetical protein